MSHTQNYERMLIFTLWCYKSHRTNVRTHTNTHTHTQTHTHTGINTHYLKNQKVIFIFRALVPEVSGRIVTAEAQM